MSNTDIQNALSSAAEVAVFAWSLLELLLTRILPLVGFLTGHLLLQFGSLLTSSLTSPAAAGVRHRRSRSSEYSYYRDELSAFEEEAAHEKRAIVHVMTADEPCWDVPQAEKPALQAIEVVEEKLLPVGKENDDTHALDHQLQTSAESMEHSDGDHGEIRRRIISETKAPSSLPSVAEEEEAVAEAAATGLEAVLPTSAEDLPMAKPAGPSDVQKTDPSETSEKDNEEANKPISSDAQVSPDKPTSSDSQMQSPEAEDSAGKVDLKPWTHTPTRQRSMELQKKVSELKEAELRKSRSSNSSSRGLRSILRVLPPSRSQLELTLRQRSRKVNFSHPQN